MLRQLAATVAGLAATTQPGSWRRGDAQLLLAEAFITAVGKPRHCPRGSMPPAPQRRLDSHWWSSWTARRR